MNVLYLVELSGLFCIYVCGASEIRIFTPNTGKKDAETVPTVYNYYTKLTTFGLTKVTGTSITFQVKSCRDSSILLSTAENLVSADFYEIFLGGAGNTFIFISRKFGPNDAAISASNLLDCNNFVSLWLSWNNGRLKAGTGTVVNQNTLMDWTDPNTAFVIAGIGVMSSWGSSGKWIFNTGDSLPNPMYCGSAEHKLSNTYETVTIKSEFQCAVQCAISDMCLGFNYNTLDLQCTVVSSNTDFLYTAYHNAWNWKTKCWEIN